MMHLKFCINVQFLLSDLNLTEKQWRQRKWDFLDLHTDQVEVSGMVNGSKVLRQWKWPQHYSINTQWQAVIL